MKENTLASLSLEELTKKEKTLKVALGALIGLVAVLTIICIYITYLRGFQFFTIFPLVFLSLILGNYSVLKKIRAEMKTRII